MIATAEMTRETSVEVAAPATPMSKPKIRMALPPTLMAFIIMERYIGTLELPIVRNTAAPALYRAIKGMEAETMRRYVLDASITFASMAPNTRCRMRFLARYSPIIMQIANNAVNRIS